MPRDYSNANKNVLNFYHEQHKNLTFQKAISFRNHYIPTKFFSVEKLLNLSDDIIDRSDPDTNLGQIYHACQTAEWMRKINSENPENIPEWMIVIALIHDLGKVSEKLYDIESCYLSGDSYPLGCKLSDHIIRRDLGFDENGDTFEEGNYESGCGFSNMIFWGHDEIIYTALKHSGTNLPEEALYTARFHSFYSWHQKNDYLKYADKKDISCLGFLRIFQLADLYSKENIKDININILKDPYYQALISRYLPHGIIL